MTYVGGATVWQCEGAEALAGVVLGCYRRSRRSVRRIASRSVRCYASPWTCPSPVTSAAPGPLRIELMVRARRTGRLAVPPVGAPAGRRPAGHRRLPAAWATPAKDRHWSRPRGCGPTTPPPTATSGRIATAPAPTAQRSLGATGQRHTITRSDMGHTIRVQETASNADGTGGPATSAATRLVHGGSYLAVHGVRQRLPHLGRRLVRLALCKPRRHLFDRGDGQHR